MYEEGDQICPVLGSDISENLLWNMGKGPYMHGRLENREAWTFLINLTGTWSGDRICPDSSAKLD
jgi:hypothetical protein